MRELRWLLLILALCLPIILLASGVRLPWTGDRPVTAPLPVPAGDQEMAWIHTTTNAATWERLVSGVVRAQMTVPGLRVDDSRAFLDSTTATPELVLSKDGHAGRLRVRWYKLQSDITTADWVRALAGRTPAPLAVIGGGSTDRALDLARPMAAQTDWKGDRPPLLITTATADYDTYDASKVRLVDLYDDRTFRFCFTNARMAEAVIDFVASRPDLRPKAGDPAGPVSVLTVYWDDDQYSVDLQDQFTEALKRRFDDAAGVRFAGKWNVPFSVGGFVSPNLHEAAVAEDVARRVRELPDERVLLVLTGTVQPARRLLRAVVEADPDAADRLVAVTGDGVPTNAVLRDGEFAWPVAAVPVPLVFFAHNNPTAWDAAGSTPAPPAGYAFAPPNGTEEAMHFGEMGRVIAGACYPPNEPLVARGDALVARLHARRPAFFDANGERGGGTGEHVLVVRPRPDPTLSVFRRGEDKRWVPVRPPIELSARGGEGRR
jgi:hypothetical protein